MCCNGLPRICLMACEEGDCKKLARDWQLHVRCVGAPPTRVRAWSLFAPLLRASVVGATIFGHQNIVRHVHALGVHALPHAS